MGQANGDDPGEIETGDVIQREPIPVEDDPGKIDIIDVREGWKEPEDEPAPDPGEIELVDIIGERDDREVDA